MVELKQLQMLAAIERHGTISGAARELGFSQPAVSQQVGNLERQLGTPLLVRTRSGVDLTEAGMVLVAIAAPTSAIVSQAVSEVQAIAGLHSGTVRVTGFPSVAATLLPTAFASLRASYPGLSFVLVEKQPPDAMEMLRMGVCDVAIVFDYPGDDAYPGAELLPNERAFTLLEETVYAVLPNDHRLAHLKVINLQDLAEDVWIAGCPNCRDHLVSACNAVGFTPKIAFETDDYLAAQALVANGLGVALLSDLSLAAANRRHRLTLIPCAPRSTRVTRAVTTSSLLTVPSVALAIDALSAAAASLSTAEAEHRGA